MLQDELYHYIDAAIVHVVGKPDNKQISLSMKREKEKSKI